MDVVCSWDFGYRPETSRGLPCEHLLSLTGLAVAAAGWTDGIIIRNDMNLSRYMSMYVGTLRTQVTFFQ